MNINNGKTGTVNIPGALHSTGGDGDGLVGNVVAYAGDIWDDIIGKNQAEINATINNVSNLPLTSINGHVGSFKNIPKEDSNVVEADETIALGVGVFADKQRSFGWGSGYQVIFLTGSNSQYTIRMNGNSSAKQPFVALATAWVGGYILTSGTTHRRVAKVTAGNFSNGVLTITTNTDLGTLNDAKYTYECKTGQQNFCAGAFINSGRQNIAIGTSNFIVSDFSTTIGAMNGSTKNAKYSNTIGSWNNNDAKGTIIGNENTLKTEDSTIVGTENSITSNSNTPSSVLGYHNNIPSGYGALIGNDNTSSGDKGYALGEHNNLQYSGIALGHYNKDYTSNSDSEKNLFVVGNGTADNARSNSIEQKQDGTLFIKGVGEFDGTNSQSASTKSLQDVLNEIASASTSGGVTTYDVTQIAIEKSALHYDDDNSNFVTYIPNGTNSAYTTNTITETSDAIIQGQNNNIQYGYSSVILGNDNTLKDEESIIIGHDNSGTSYNTITLGTYNENKNSYSVLIGDFNHNDSRFGVNIGNNNYCYGSQTNILLGSGNELGNEKSPVHDEMGIIVGSNNQIVTKYNDSSDYHPNVAVLGRGLKTDNDGVLLGFYNAKYTVNGEKYTPYFVVADGTLSFDGEGDSNLIEAHSNGDFYIKGLGGFTGNNSDVNTTKSLQEVISGISASTESKLSQTPNNSLEFGLTNFVNNTSDSFAGGVGVNAKGDRAFGFGQTYMTVYVTGSGESDNNDEYPYSLMIGNPTGYTVQNAVAEEFAKTMVGAYLLDTTNNFHRYAIINSITYNGQNQPLSVKLDCSLGQKTNAVWTVENVGSGRTFSVGGYGNIGQYGVAMGNYAFNSGKNSIVMGQYNANGGQNSSVFGVYNHNSQTGGNLLGTQNTNTGQYSNVIGLQNTNSGQYANIIGRNNNNNCASTTIIGIANDIKETTYPSCVVGYNNSGDTSTQQFTLGYENHGTRGQYAPANTSCTWMIGHDLITSRGGIAIGRYNKDYDVQDTDKQNFFVISQGDSNVRSNSFELKANGDLYVYGVGGFNGINSDGATVKTLQAKIAELEARIAQLEGGNS